MHCSSRQLEAPGIQCYKRGAQGSVGCGIPGDPDEEVPEGSRGGFRTPSKARFLFAELLSCPKCFWSSGTSNYPSKQTWLWAKIFNDYLWDYNYSINRPIAFAQKPRPCINLSIYCAYPYARTLNVFKGNMNMKKPISGGIENVDSSKNVWHSWSYDIPTIDISREACTTCDQAPSWVFNTCCEFNVLLTLLNSW